MKIQFCQCTKVGKMPLNSYICIFFRFENRIELDDEIIKMKVRNIMKKIIYFVLILMCAVVIIFAILKNSKSVEVETTMTEYTPEEEITDSQNRMTIVSLYFWDPSSNKLVPEARNVDVKELIESPYRKILDLLIEGSENSTIGKTIPEGTCVNSVNLEGENLVIDFNENFISGREVNSEEQLHIIYSVVDTFLELKEVNSVSFLINGELVDGMSDKFVSRKSE